MSTEIKWKRTASRIPSLKTLRRLTEQLPEGTAGLLRKVLLAKTRDILETCVLEKHDERFQVTRTWVWRCYNRPSIVEMKLQAANELLEGFGVEYAGEVDMREGPPLEYVNVGDSYGLTLCRFRGRWVVSSWGDIVERHEKLFRDE